jgi:hypothetical protein
VVRPATAFDDREQVSGEDPHGGTITPDRQRQVFGASTLGAFSTPRP